MLTAWSLFILLTNTFYQDADLIEVTDFAVYVVLVVLALWAIMRWKLSLYTPMLIYVVQLAIPIGAY
jgi:hypothetical protein